ncbi:MAG TPA: helix-turn-helix domain-containing protein [Candidatus Sulfotelmatobacter sp.]|jgi:excisionase family DNA binding protein|nr:helix-turn-helix domain-containing protein [Candidatus Sulfotelmatobacter sp.]
MQKFDGYYTVKELSEILKVAKSTVRSWIKNGKLTATKRAGMLLISYDNEINNNFFVEQIRKKHYRPKKPYTAENIKGYAEWHALLDEFSWLIKVSYSSPNQVKKKNFRADQLFANYINLNKIKIEKINRMFRFNPKPKKSLIDDDIKRGWYNEISYLLPLKKSTLGHSFNDITLNMKSSELRFEFPSWKIISCYYAVYFYLRSITLFGFDNFRLSEHNSTINSFKNNILNPLSKTIWKFPFDISYVPQKRKYRSQLLIQNLRHTQFRYSAYPREPFALPIQLFENIYNNFKKRGKAFKKPCIYTIFDYLHDFRTWANYLDIDNLLSLRGTGYKTFLDQNLSLILFFIGGISELCYIAVFGKNVYIEVLQKFYDEFVTNSPRLVEDFIYTSIYQRLAIYNKLGLMDASIKLKKTDINTVSIS